ncbi:hypothetical protein DFJ74DRAFT_661436 [Hyaloraphidium curvatum]|nr:hypothetical protein DFJ74DRAFT_661436 [Hyaloraphidium curvatum]
MHLKAEALYALGRFEDALAWFHRGRRRCPPGGDGEFRTGIGKAEEAIRNALALDGGRRTGGAGKAAPKAGKGGEADAAVLGPLAQDLAYLRAMRADPLLEGMDAVKALAGEGVEYLENRAAFWRSQKGLDRGTQGRADGEEPGKGRIGAADATARTKK